MKPRILIVDDEEVNQLTLESILCDENFELLFAGNGAEACAKAQAVKPDLILLDVMMPVMDGFEACRRIRADTTIGAVPIVMITALDDHRSRVEGLRSGADDFLTKPVQRDELRARVRTVLALNRFRAIAEQRARFERLFALAPTAIVLVNAEGRIVQANAEAARVLGQAAAALEHRDLAAFFHEGVSAGLRDRIRRALAGDETVQAAQRLERATEDGRQVLSLRLTLLAESEPLVLLMLDDVTAEVAAREELESMNRTLDQLVAARTRQLEEANALLLSYASFVSHDLRSPLAVMKGYLSLLEDDYIPLPAEAKSYIGHASKAAQTMDDMIGNILQLAREEHAGSAPVEPIDPKPLIQRITWHFTAASGPRKPTFVVQALPKVPVSAPLLERVFYNLIGNAVKYCAHKDDPQVEIGELPGQVVPTIYVKDNGVGFDARDADKLFREFSRLPTAGETEGLGLGLSLVSRLVRNHRGRIWAEGRPGEGATFFVQFEVPEAASAATT